MKNEIILETDSPKMRTIVGHLGKFGTALYITLLAVFIAGCTKDVPNDLTAGDPLSSATIAATIPADLADTVVINPVVAVTFKSAVTPSEVSASTITLMDGTTPVQGKISVSGNMATFTPIADLKPDTKYIATVKSSLKSGSVDGKSDHNEHSWSFRTGKHRRANAPTVVSVLPLNSAISVAIAVQPTVTFSEEMTESTIKTTIITLKQGTTTIEGTVTYSGKIATFKPASSLAADKVYTGTVTFGAKSNDEGDDHESENKLSGNFTWSFTTGVGVADVLAPTVTTVVPANNATAIAITSKPVVTFSEAMNATTITSTTFTLKQGTTVVAGTVAYAGTTATFTPTSSLVAGLVYTGTITTGAKDVAGNAIAANYTWSFTTGAATTTDVIAPTVTTVVPANNATAIAITSKPVVTFSEAMNAATITATTFTLKQGTTVVAGTVAYAGTTATFTPTSSLVAGLVYTGTITTGAKDVAGNAIAANYTWSFTTGAATTTDVIAPTVSSVVPANSATAIAITSKPTVTFSEAMSAATITSTTFTLKQGTTVVAGTVVYSGTTATFTPTSSLVAGAVYTGTITTGAKDVAGNAIAANYTWSFTTATAVVVDTTPPTVLTIVPASGASSIALSSKVTAAFSEAMTATTISSSTFTVSEGTTAVAGTVAYSGTTATFSPTSALVAGKVYTATITTGAKDAAGNALAASKVWSFTTIAAVSVTSWSTQVWPIIQSKCTVCHGASGGSAGINMGSYAQVSALSNTQIDNAGMYTKMGVTATEKAIIQAWIAQGKLNN